MLVQEWKSLLKNRMLLIVLAGIIAIPAIYTTLFLGSMWDPYGNLSKLPVAVVNLDQSVEYEGATLRVGEELEDKLRENEELDFQFVKSEDAEKGLENGDYYMVITIPKDFSKASSTVMDEEPQKMQLEYSTNPAKNYIASKLSESAFARIKNEVANEVTKTYTETIMDQFVTIADGMQDGADGAEKIGKGTEKVKTGNQKIKANLEVLEDGCLSFVDGSEELTVGLKEYTQGVTKVAHLIICGISSSRITSRCSGMFILAFSSSIQVRKASAFSASDLPVMPQTSARRASRSWAAGPN